MKKNLKTIIVKLINYLGYDLVKRYDRKTKRTNETEEGTPIKVEFIGPPGVGKSTIFKETLRLRENDGEWITSKELLKSLDNYSNYNYEIKEYDVLLGNYFKQILSKNLPIRNKIKLLKYFLKITTEDELVNKFAGKQIVVFSEGLFHNGNNCIMDIEKTNPDIFRQIIQKKAIVNCINQPDIILEYIKKRNEKEKLRMVHRDLTDSELFVKTKSSIKRKKELMQLLIKYNVPCLEINTADNITENAHKVRNFINSLNQNN